MKRNAALGLCLLVAACSGESKTGSAPVSSAPKSTAPPPAAAQTSGAPGCPHTGKWALCNVETRLRQSAFVAKRLPEKPARPGFSVAPVVYKLGKSGRLEVFIYPDEAAMAKDMAAIDTLTVAPRGAPSPWPGTPVLIRSGNLAAVFITDNSIQIERLTLALTAGPPQPGSPR